jgi:hypothetical protein
MHASALLASNDALLPTPRSSTRTDAAEIEAAVGKYCRTLRASASDTVAAISWALRQGGDTLSAIRAGRQRAAQLHDRSIRRQPSTLA